MIGWTRSNSCSSLPIKVLRLLSSWNCFFLFCATLLSPFLCFFPIGEFPGLARNGGPGLSRVFHGAGEESRRYESSQRDQVEFLGLNSQFEVLVLVLVLVLVRLGSSWLALVVWSVLSAKQAACPSLNKNAGKKKGAATSAITENRRNPSFRHFALSKRL